MSTGIKYQPLPDAGNCLLLKKNPQLASHIEALLRPPALDFHLAS